MHNKEKTLNGKATAAGIAKHYGVNEKTIRDIWTGRTWCGETCSKPNLSNPVGRPKGKRDSRPRNSKKEASKNSNLIMGTAPIIQSTNRVEASTIKGTNAGLCLVKCTPAESDRMDSACDVKLQISKGWISHSGEYQSEDMQISNSFSIDDDIDSWTSSSDCLSPFIDPFKGDLEDALNILTISLPSIH